MKKKSMFQLKTQLIIPFDNRVRWFSQEVCIGFSISLVVQGKSSSQLASNTTKAW